VQGTIIKGIGGFYYVKAEDFNVYECKARGIFRKEKVKPMIGDRVVINIDGNNKGSITDIQERSSSLIRPPVANIDTLVIVLAAKNPDPDFLLCDKLILAARIKNIEPVICISKTDLKCADEIFEIYKTSKCRIFEICTVNGTGIDEIGEFLKGKTCAFAGLSGVGKSTLLNSLVDTSEEIETGDISKINRGKHTTRHVELFELKGGGYVLDTPGFSSFETEVLALKANELCEYYPEMADLNDKCRFKGCSHINEPDCAVKDALTEGLISKSRYENYITIYKSLSQIKDWER